jgi:DNA invertase Pin-like site-specific DNA recombinase
MSDLKPVFGYLRVSGKGQLEGDGQTRQRASIQEYCERKGFRVVRWFFDGGVSGEMDVGNRDEYVTMLQSCGPGTTTTIVVERADRLARTLAVSELACEDARKKGLTILEAASDTDLTNSDDPTRVAMRQMLGVMAEWGKNTTLHRLRSARNRIRQSGRQCEGRRAFHCPGARAAIVQWKDSGNCTWRQIMKHLKDGEYEAPDGTFYWAYGTVRALYTQEKERLAKEQREPARPEILTGLPV